MRPLQIVIDTCVLDTALRSSKGASYLLLSRVGISQGFQINLSVPLVVEYEDVAKRHCRVTGLSHADIEAIIDYLCSVGNLREVFFLWRPFLRDPKDEMVLELAVEAECDAIVTFNVRDFAGAERFGIRVLKPADLLREIGELP